MHIAIIPDGTRRYSKKYNLPLKSAYQMGIDQVFEVSKWFFDLGTDEISVFGFSAENWAREESEIKLLHNLFLRNADKFLKKKTKEKVQIRFAGDLSKFSKPLKMALSAIEKTTLTSGGQVLNICLNYSSREEIVMASNKREFSTEESLQEGLQVKNDVDLVLRTGGEQRVSGFLLWQMKDAEIYFEKKLWEELTQKDIKRIWNWYQLRDRRMGK